MLIYEINTKTWNPLMSLVGDQTTASTLKGIPTEGLGLFIIFPNKIIPGICLVLNSGIIEL
jgi:hypothetical protein